METAAILRCELILRFAPEDTLRSDAHWRFFRAVEFLAAQGLDVVSETWRLLLETRNLWAHLRGAEERITKREITSIFRRRYEGSEQQVFSETLGRLQQLMRTMCDAPECKSLPRTEA